jgi:hypothetical protein
MALQPALPPAPPPPMGTPPRGGPPKMPPAPLGAVPPPPGVAGAPGAPGVGAPGAGVPGEGQPEDLEPGIGFFQQPWVQNILPFVTSLTVHAGIVVLGFLAVALVKQAAPALLEQEQTIIPEATLADAGPPGGVPNEGPNNDPFKQTMQDKDPDGGKADGVSSKAGPTVNLADAGGGSGDGDTSPSIGLGMGGLGGGKGIGGGKGDGSGSGSGDGGGPLAMFGAPGGGAIGPHGPVFGNGGNARNIVFVCDASGSMLNKMATLKNELEKAVGGLKPIQTFNIIFFQDEKCVALDKAELISATSANQRNAYKFLDDVTTSGTTDPIPGLTLAFGQHPQLVYLLTDGDFPDNKAVKAKIAELNHDHRVKINTIAFVNNQDTDTDFLTLLDDIAKESGGKFKKVAENELNQ